MKDQWILDGTNPVLLLTCSRPQLSRLIRKQCHCARRVSFNARGLITGMRIAFIHSITVRTLCASMTATSSRIIPLIRLGYIRLFFISTSSPNCA
uniref:ATCBL3 n=1 Tax=Arundo donax TaxID=35708 RepID=A0A0A9EPI6_ARUDO